MKGAKSKSNLPVVDPFETGREFVRSLGKPSTKWLADEAQQSSRTFLEQILGLNLKKDSTSTHADGAAPVENVDPAHAHKNVEIFNFMKHKASASEKHAEKAPHRQAEAAIDYHKNIVENRKQASKSEVREMQRNIEQIKVELSKLITSSQVLKLEFAEVSVEQTSPTIGEYHINFFEWMLVVIRTAREKVEDSNAWLGTVKGKGAKKDYWGMFKKHGTTFGLSGERAVATQVG
jgi:uncharacterized protein DUF5660